MITLEHMYTNLNLDFSIILKNAPQTVTQKDSVSRSMMIKDNSRYFAFKGKVFILVEES